MSSDRARVRRLRSAAFRVVTPVLTGLFGVLPWGAAQAVGRTVGRLGWRFSARDRGRSLDHLSVAFPDLPDEERQDIARHSFLAHGMNLAECLHLMRRTPKGVRRHFEVEGWRHVEAVGDRPLLLITGHCGNWEFLSLAFQRAGRPFAAVVRRQQEAWAEDLATRLRRRFGAQIIRRGTGTSARELLRVVRDNVPLVMVIDQDIRVDSVWVPFFGRLARTPSGAASIAFRRDMAVVPIFCERLADGTHVVRFQPALELPDDITEATAKMTRVVEEQVRRQPRQWVWMHRRWRHRPPEEAAGESPA